MSRCLRGLRQVERSRGQRTEDRFFEAMEVANRRQNHEWILGVRRATHEEDTHRGIDAVVKTDIGDLLIQIKSSEKGAEEFRKGPHFRRNKFIGVLVIRENYTSDDIRGKAHVILMELRGKILAERV